MLAPRLCRLLLALTFALIVWGGIVHATGSSLACPDWPLCYGMMLPPMQGGIFVEHGHRLLAAAVAVVAAAQLVAVWPRRSVGIRLFAALGLALVCFQACLGGLTVLLKLPPPVSVAHLATSMLFLGWAVLCVAWIGPASAGRALAAAALWLQMVLGAAVRHTASSMSCGAEAFTCAGAWWPASGPQWLQTCHRLMSLAVMGGIVAATVGPMRAARLNRQRHIYRLCLAAHILVLMQCAVGVLAIKTGVHAHVVTLHLAMGTALWGCMVRLWADGVAPPWADLAAPGWPRKLHLGVTAP